MTTNAEYEAAKDALENFEKDIKNVLGLLPTNIDGEFFKFNDFMIMKAMVREAIEEAAYEKTKSIERQIREYEMIRKAS